MKKILTILLLLSATTAFGQADSNRIDSLENQYVQANDSPDSTNAEMSFEEMEELWTDLEKKKQKRHEIKNLILETSGVYDNYIQDPQDYRNFYYRKPKKKCSCY